MRRFFGFKRDATELDSNLTPVTTTTTSTATAAAITTTASTVSTATSVNNTRKYKKKGSKSDLTLDEFDAVPAPFSGSLQRGELIPLQLKQLRDEQQQQQQAEKEEGVAEKQEDAVMADVTYGEVATTTTTTTTATTTVTATSDDEDDEGKEEQFHACLEETSPELGNCALLPDDDVTSSTSTSAVPSDSSSSSSTEQTSIQQRQQEPFQNNNMISTNNDDNNNDNSNNNDDAISTDNAPPPRSPSWRMMHTKSASSSTLVFSKRISIAVDLERPSLIQRFKNARQSTALKRNSQCMVSHNPLYASASASVSSDDSGSGSGGGHDVSIDDIYSIRRAIQEADAAAAAAAAAAAPPAAGGGGGGGKEGQPQRQQQLAAPAATPAEEAPITIQAPSLGVSGSSDPDDVGEISSKSKEIRRSIRLQIDKKIKESADTAGTPSSGGGGGGVGSPRGQPPKRRSLRMSIQITISAERFSAVNAELDMILRCKEKRDVLREHCRKERSEENLNFWECIENEWYPVAHKLTLSERRQLANKIYQEFVPWSSPQPLNLSQSAVNRIWRQLESPHPITVDIFDEAKRDVEINMLDSFHRFRRTQLYADLIAGKLNNNNNNNCNSNNDGNNNNNNGLTIPPAAAAAAASSVEKEKKKFLSEFLAAVVNYKAPKATSLLKKTASRKSIFFKHWQSGGSNSSNGNYGNDSDKQSRRRSLMPLRSEDLRTASELLRGLEELGSEKYAEIAAYYEARKELEEAAVAVVKSPASSAAAPAFPSSAADHKLT